MQLPSMTGSGEPGGRKNGLYELADLQGEQAQAEGGDENSVRGVRDTSHYLHFFRLHLVGYLQFLDYSRIGFFFGK